MKAFPANYTISIAFILIAVLIIAPAMAGTSTTVHVVKLANDGTTIINQTTVTYGWMESNLPVLGDETTDYYLQGPVLSGDRWNPPEDSNLKNWGRNKGTDVREFCNLVGGMKSGETVKIWDGSFSKTFPYPNVYTPDQRQGPIIISWWCNGTYVPGFSDGMRLLFLADTSTNPFGYHCYGAWDMNQTLDPAYHYFYYNSGDPTPLYPSTTGLSVKYVNEIIIYSTDPAPVAPVAAFTADVTNGQVPLTVQFTDASTGTSTLSYAWDFTNDGTVDSTIQNPAYMYTTAGTYTVDLTVTNVQGTDSEIKTGYIVVNSPVSPEYSLLLTGDHSVTLTKAQIEAIVTSGPSASWTDSTNQRTWQGIPLWYLVGAVDDADNGFNFNTTRASMGYSVQVRAADGFNKTFTSSTIASNNNYIVANTLNGTVIPFTDPTNPSKIWWALKLVGSGPTGGNSVGNITEIRLIGLPAAPIAPVADFAANMTMGAAPLQVQFTDASSGSPSTWSWDFNNDGTIDSTIQSPVYTYSAAGVYSVNFSVSNAAGSNSTLKSNYINVTSAGPVVDTIYSGTVSLSTGTFNKVAYNSGASYDINTTTPLGALNGAGLSFKISDKNFGTQGLLPARWYRETTTIIKQQERPGFAR